MATGNYKEYMDWKNANVPQMGELGDYESITDPNGNLLSQYKLSGGPNVNYSTDIASNPWVQMMLAAQGVQTDNQLDTLAKDTNAGQASAYSALATRGGLSQGARERIGAQSARNLMMGRQDVRRNSDLARLGLMTTGLDKQKDLDLANRNYETDINKFNLGSQLKNKDAGDQFKMSKYQEQMKAWASYQTALAQEDAGKK